MKLVTFLVITVSALVVLPGKLKIDVTKTDQLNISEIAVKIIPVYLKENVIKIDFH